ncbi:kinase-like protein [Ascobolus immersus RN42]|uniref:cyclin-dependent kinase n=1 Tax=Ascobolus immersus RN42 TaxID=1160509 RepID=A0A3N4HZJ1_ASCIM|nr:kinase-like protein [Ascobolus immersus RN42]
MAASWKEDLSFTDRSTNIFDLVKELKKQTTPPDNVLGEAQRLEQDCLDRAATKAEYDAFCITTIRSLLHKSASPEPAQDHLPPHLPPSNHPPIGPYQNPHHLTTTLNSTLYKAVDPTVTPSRLVCLKLTTLPAHPPHNPHLESHILSTLPPHPHILPYLSHFTEPSPATFILVTPYFPLSYADYLIPSRFPSHPLSFHRLVLHQVTSALAHLHSHNILHRDIKPSNIHLSQLHPPHAILIDFSISYTSSSPSLTTETPTHLHHEIGTSSYRAPELLFGSRSYNNGVDLWALGCIVAQVLRGGEELFDGGEMGTELGLISSMFRTLGTPGADNWEESGECPDWGKMGFVEFPRRGWGEVLEEEGRDGTYKEGVELVGKLLNWNSRQRLKAEEAVKHPFLQVSEEEVEVLKQR